MDEYFLTKKATEIILDNLNDHFIKCLIRLSVQERYTENMKLIIEIVELIKTYLATRRNDLLSSCIKYTNKSYYTQLCDSLFRLIQNHLTNLIQNHLTNTKELTKYIFIYDLITKYNDPFIPNFAATTGITRNFKNTCRHRFNSIDDNNDDYNDINNNDNNDDINDNNYETKDAGTLFKEAYNKLKKNKIYHNNKDKDIELSNITINNSDDLV
jgi:hypothetical protein